MKWTRIAGALCAAALALGMSAAALAEDAPAVAGEAAGDVCAVDAARLCEDAKDDSTRTLCLKQHERELSEACRSRTRGAWNGAFAAACEADAKLRCANAPGGGLALIGCLANHRDELSEPCGSYLQLVAPKKKP
ncbi:MAG: hypothetical protein JSU66_16550 [Deltaproteobacteria bacterium]|nr:MAG: hypothetical protein JSU66_16550 [Deltaproteobacteria bacterium]